MPTGTLFWLISTLSGYVSLLFSALSIACGLYLSSEWAEDNPSHARKACTYTLYLVLLAHPLLAFSGVGVGRLAVSAAFHCCYGTLLKRFPFVNPLSLSALGSLSAVVVCHYVWFGFFYENYTPIFQVTGFFLLMIWSTPLCFFVSLCLESDAMPLAGGGGGGKRHGVFKEVVDFAREMYARFKPKGKR